MSILTLAAATLAVTIVTAAANPRSGVQQPNFASCSDARQACQAGTSRRGGVNSASCDKAYKTCMRTGVWDTYGYYGRRLTGVARQ
jgi:hypothetical protein